jgi:hypothetical protein
MPGTWLCPVRRSRTCPPIRPARSPARCRAALLAARARSLARPYARRSHMVEHAAPSQAVPASSQGSPARTSSRCPLGSTSSLYRMRSLPPGPHAPAYGNAPSRAAATPRLRTRRCRWRRRRPCPRTRTTCLSACSRAAARAARGRSLTRCHAALLVACARSLARSLAHLCLRVRTPCPISRFPCAPSPAHS